LVAELVQESRPLTESKPAINSLAKSLENLNSDNCLKVALHAIEKIKPRMLLFEEEDMIFKKELADIYSARDDHESAARVLETINLEQTNRAITANDKVDVWLDIAQHWFNADDSVNAEKFVNKAAHIMHLCSNDLDGKTLQLRYKQF